jgi:hypothetical protein
MKSCTVAISPAVLSKARALLSTTSGFTICNIASTTARTPILLSTALMSASSMTSPRKLRPHGKPPSAGTTSTRSKDLHKFERSEQRQRAVTRRGWRIGLVSGRERALSAQLLELTVVGRLVQPPTKAIAGQRGQRPTSRLATRTSRISRDGTGRHSGTASCCHRDRIAGRSALASPATAATCQAA